MTAACPIILAPGVALPLQAVTATFSLLAVRGSGKTYLMLKAAEEMLRAQQCVVIFDVVGVCWGLRSSADGKAEGFPILIAGGDHGDLPLADGDGKTLAQFVVAERCPLILDLSHLSKAAARRVVADFLLTLYQLKGREADRFPMHLFIDEADEFAPQRVQPEITHCFNAVDTVVRRGRARGIGCTLVTQRPAVLNKDVLTQTDCLVAMRIVSPQDRKAVKEWVDAHGTAKDQADLLGSLASLSVGEAWFWSPAMFDLFVRAKVAQRVTFDSSSTPKAGVMVAAPKRAAAVDLEGLRTKLGGIVERARENDPDTLKARVRELEADLKRKPEPQAPEPDEAAIELARAEGRAIAIEGVRTLTDHIGRSVEELRTLLKAAMERTETIDAEHHALQSFLTGAIQTNKRAVQALTPPIRRHEPTPRPSTVLPAATVLSPAHLRLLNAIAWWNAMGFPEPSKAQVAAKCGLTVTSGGYKNYLGALRSSGLIEYPAPNIVTLTDQGAAMAERPGRFDVAALRESIQQVVSPQEWRIIEFLLKAPRRSANKADIAAAVGLTVTSGGFKNYLGHLRTLGFVSYPSAGVVQLTEVVR